MIKNAEIISIGTELLLGHTTDINSTTVSKFLLEHGVDVLHKQTVGDNMDHILDALDLATKRSDLIITTGGLGATQDDLTREAIVAFTEDTYKKDEEAATRIHDFMYSMNKLPSDALLKQALIPSRATPIKNPIGTAISFIQEHQGKFIIALPGPNQEVISILDDELGKKLGELIPSNSTYIETINLTGLGESEVHDMIIDQLASEDPIVSVYANIGEVHIRIISKSKEKVIQKRDHIKARLQKYIYGYNDTTLELCIAKKLAQEKKTISFAEGCTVGYCCKILGSVPGISKVLKGGTITYTPECKRELLNIPQEIIDKYSAISEECARIMAINIREKMGSDIGVSATGMTNPSPDAPELPIGLVYICITSKDLCSIKKHYFPGNRTHLQERFAKQVFTNLWKFLIRH